MWRFTSLAMLIVLMACENPTSRPIAEPTPVDLPADAIREIAWVTDGSVVMAYAVDPHGAEDRLWLVDLREQEPRELPIDPDDPECSSIRFHHPQRLSDGRVGFVRSCLSPAGPSNDQFSLVAFDLASETEEVLADLPRLADAYSFDPAMEQAVVSFGSVICQGIAIVTADGVQPINATVAATNSSFNLADPYDAGEGGDCPDQGIATLPVWSPTTDTIAFFASPDAIGHRGQDRLDQPYGLYLLDLEDDHAVALLEGIRAPGAPRWSEDGRHLLFNGEIEGTAGLWLLDVEGGAQRRVSDVALRSPEWAPSGQSAILALRDTDDSTAALPIRELVMLDLDTEMEGDPTDRP